MNDKKFSFIFSLMILISVLSTGFVAAASGIAITNPDGGENWGGAQNINWDVTDNINTDRFEIRYSNDEGVSWVNIASMLYYTARSYEWITTSVSDGTNYLIQIVESATSSADDVSDAVFTIDNTVPEVGSISISPKSGDYISGTSDISASVSDDTSGVASCEYTLDGSAWVAVTYSSGDCSVEGIDTSGATSINMRAIDSAGNIGTGSAISVTPDTTNPSTSDSGTDTAWRTSDVTVTLSPSDGESGLSDTKYCTGAIDCTPDTVGTSVVVSTDGINYVRYYSVDNVGNSEAIKTATNTVKIDKTKPTTTDDYSNHDSWVDSSQTITLSPVDTTSGIASTKYCTGASCTPNIEGTSYTIITEGTNYFRYASTDNAGNVQDTVEKIVKIDTINPVVVIDSPADNSVIIGNLVLGVTVTETNDGFCEYELDGNESTATPIGCTGGTIDTIAFSEGKHIIEFFAYDLANNEGSVSLNIIVDNDQTLTVGSGSEDFSTIQVAITAANTGDTINVAAGLYNEQIVIDKALTLKGATFDTSKRGYVVPANYNWDTSTESVIQWDGVSGNQIQITSDDVIIEGFIISNTARTSQAIYGNSHLIMVLPSTDSNNISIINNVIGPNTDAIAQDGTHGRFGLYLNMHSYNLGCTVTGNKVFDALGNGNGIMVWGTDDTGGNGGDATGTIISGNEITGNHRTGIEISGGIAHLEISDNDIHANGIYSTDDKSDQKYGNGIPMIRDGSDFGEDAKYIEDITITDNNIYDNEKSGIYMGPRNKDITITSNNIYNNGILDSYEDWNGIIVDLTEVYDGRDIANAEYDFATNIDANENKIYGNGLYGVRVIGTPTNGFELNATFNYWGASNGPSGEGTGSGDFVSTYVDFTPWAEDNTFTRFYAPVLAAIGDKSINEGSTLTITLSATDADAGETLTFSDNIDFGILTGDSFEWTPTGTDQGTKEVTFTVSDGDLTDSETITITVNNVVPIANAGIDQTVNEGEGVSFSESATDAGSDTLSYSWSFGDTGTSTEQNPTHTYIDEGTYTVTLTVNDGDASNVDTMTVTVNNVEPVVEAGDDQTVDEGDLVTINPTFTDAGNSDTHTATINWDDSNTDNLGPVTSPISKTHTYTDDGIYTVTLTVTDNDGGIGTNTMTVTVNNVAPVADAGADQDSNEGSEVSFTGSATDAGSDTLSYSWDFDFSDGIQEDATGTGATHTYVDEGIYTITLTVNDGTTISSDTLTVTVSNVNPVANAGIDQTVNEGTSVSYSGSATDAGSDTLSYSWSFGDSSSDATGQTPTHTYADDGTYTVTLTVTDGDSGSHTDTMTVNVDNVAPVVDAGADQNAINEGDLVTINPTFTDVGGDDAYTATVDWGDGTAAIDLGAVTSPITTTHIYTGDATYTLTLTVTDDDSGVGTDNLIVIVSNVAPVITSASANTTTVVTGETILFAGIATDAGADTLTYTWDFGEGNPETGENLTHIYSTKGNYIVNLTVTDDDGGSVISSNIEITVYDLIWDLASEWNLVSVPKILTNNNPSVLSSNDVWEYDGASWITPTTIGPGVGYWVDNNTLTSLGLDYSDNIDDSNAGQGQPNLLIINQGWNLIGLMNTTSMTVEDAFTGVSGEWVPNIYYVIKYNEGTEEFEELSKINNMNSGEGYWVYRY